MELHLIHPVDSLYHSVSFCAFPRRRLFVCISVKINYFHCSSAKYINVFVFFSFSSIYTFVLSFRIYAIHLRGKLYRLFFCSKNFCVSMLLKTKSEPLMSLRVVLLSLCIRKITFGH